MFFEGAEQADAMVIWNRVVWCHMAGNAYLGKAK